jgi:hypothetical protein
MKVVGVEDEKIFVNAESLLLSTDFDCDDGLETSSVCLLVMHLTRRGVEEMLTMVGFWMG